MRSMSRPTLLIPVLALFMCAGKSPSPSTPDTCTHTTYNWNVKKKKAVNFRTVRHPYSEVTKEETDAATNRHLS